MKLKDIGERKLTYGITSELSIPFDDCAYLERDGYYEVMTTDMVNSRTHFPENTPFHHMGWYAMAVNISDLAAKGAEPLAYLVAMGLPRDMEEEGYNEIMRGMKECVKKYGGKIVGGDTKEGDGIIIAVAAIGKVKREEFMPRLGMKEGDAVYVTGELGRGGVALRESNIDDLLLIEPRVREGRILASSRKVNACMDLSDGLASSLHQMMRINNLGFRIYGDAIPVCEKAKKYDDAMNLALYHGGDYELLFTMPEEYENEIKERINIIRIGEVVEERKVVLVVNGEEKEMRNEGYEHFR